MVETLPFVLWVEEILVAAFEVEKGGRRHLNARSEEHTFELQSRTQI